MFRNPTQPADNSVCSAHIVYYSDLHTQPCWLLHLIYLPFHLSLTQPTQLSSCLTPLSGNRTPHKYAHILRWLTLLVCLTTLSNWVSQYCFIMPALTSLYFTTVNSHSLFYLTNHVLHMTSTYIRYTFGAWRLRGRTKVLVNMVFYMRQYMACAIILPGLCRAGIFGYKPVCH